MQSARHKRDTLCREGAAGHAAGARLADWPQNSNGLVPVGL
jgi:hypothetical protein